MSGGEPGSDGTVVRERLRALPAVDRLAGDIRAAAGADAGGVEGREPTPAEAIAAARAVLAERRAEILAGDGDGADVDLVTRARARLKHSLRRVINATGVVIHTNLGRAPLADAAAEAVAEAARGYVNLELDLSTGRRGGRDTHVGEVLCELTGAEDALVVNNGASAALLAAAALAGRGGSIVVSRGQLVEIGGGFRIPEVVEQAGARLVEVGTTNRTRIEDYRRALAGLASEGAERVVVLRVHQSNFRTVGFVEEVAVEELCALGVPVIDDVGSGALVDAADVLVDEPPVRASVAAGAALVCFSGDKLVGGPQAGILVGRREAVEACRRHPLARALRIGRLPMAALAATLALYRDPERALAEVPVLRMLSMSADELHARAERLAAATGGAVVTAVGRVGGGALPLVELEGPAVAIDPPNGDVTALAARLRDGDPPIVGRIERDRLLLDPRTLSDDEEATVVAGVRAALGSERP